MFCLVTITLESVNKIMGKNDSNRYDNNKRFSEGERKQEKRIKSPVSTSSKRSKEREALRRAKDIISTKVLYGGLEDDDLDEDLFDELEE